MINPSVSMAGVTDARLKAALMAANIPTLLVTTAMISGDTSLLDDPQMPSGNDVDGTRNMSEQRQQIIRDKAFEVLTALRDGKIHIPEVPDKARMQQLASVLAGESVASEYIPMMLEDMAFTDSAVKRVAFTSPRPERGASDISVLIIGAGLSGLAAAIQLERLGIAFTIIEKNSSVGGTWWENRYPACGVDTPNHFYSYSFEPNTQWAAFYSKANDLHRYISSVADKYKLKDKITLNTEVVRAQYLPDSSMWQLSLRDQSGTETSQTVNVLISAVGQVNRPRIPDFKGKDRFKGAAFHSAEWQHIDLRGKKVAVIGTGASSMQFAPEIASQVASLTILQRSPHWIRILPDYHRSVTADKQFLLSHVPFYQNWYRFKLFWIYGDGIWDSIHKDPHWSHPERSLNAENERHRNIYIRNLRTALHGREDLLAKVVPDYPPFAKRMLIDNHWCQMLQQDHVSLVTSGVQEITELGLIDDTGTEHAADVIIYGTGFHAHNFLWPIEVAGKYGKTLAATWGDDARAYLGMSTPDFPNLFFLYGPNTNLGHGGSLIFHIECQSRYIAQCLIHMLEIGAQSIEVRQEPHDIYNKRVDEEHNKMVWTHPGVNNWYKNTQGRVVSNSPWRLVDYWSLTHTPKMEDFTLL